MKLKNKARCNRAFSLVELSIVLVILGLLVGGILSGQSLIRAAEMRSVATEHAKYSAAMHTFKDKYFAIPGDMNNAVKFWGAQAGGTTDGVDAVCAALAVAATGAPTCNGNGDGNINTTNHESFRSWQHLANAGLIEGTYSGVAGAGGSYNSIPGTNVPRSRLSSAGWSLLWFGPYSGDATWHAADYGHILAFGSNGATEDDWMNNPIIRAEEAWNIDTKVDDGKPHQGRVITMKNASRPNCINATNDGYLLTDTTTGCNLLFLRVI